MGTKKEEEGTQLNDIGQKFMKKKKSRKTSSPLKEFDTSKVTANEDPGVNSHDEEDEESVKDYNNFTNCNMENSHTESSEDVNRQTSEDDSKNKHVEERVHKTSMEEWKARVSVAKPIVP